MRLMCLTFSCSRISLDIRQVYWSLILRISSKRGRSIVKGSWNSRGPENFKDSIMRSSNSGGVSMHKTWLVPFEVHRVKNAISYHSYFLSLPCLHFSPGMKIFLVRIRLQVASKVSNISRFQLIYIIITGGRGAYFYILRVPSPSYLVIWGLCQNSCIRSSHSVQHKSDWWRSSGLWNFSRPCGGARLIRLSFQFVGLPFLWTKVRFEETLLKSVSHFPTHAGGICITNSISP